ncbi:MAG: DUF169 domain-containing protein [bacterium]|nr:DUF169 domain-containing protein [bacterium]
MKTGLKEEFINKWEKYFGNAELPITFYYSNDNKGVEEAPPAKGWNCFVGELAKVRKGRSLSFSADSVSCGGGKRYLGFSNTIRPDFEYFLSCGIPDKVEGERYIRTPEMVLEIMDKTETLPMSGKQLIFKRWDALTEEDNPEVVIFFATPDVLSGLFTLANYDQTEPHSSFTPFGAGCATIIQYPYLEKDTERPRAVIGMFDVSARPMVPADRITFAVPLVKLEAMIDYMDESFLITESWEKVKSRINK